MSLISLGQPETDLLPEGGTPLPPRRRYLVLAGATAALLLAGGSAAYLLVGGTQAANQVADQPMADPFVPGAAVGTGPATGSDAADPGSVPPSAAANPPTAPTASMAVAARPAGTYRVPGPLCASMDLTALVKAAGAPVAVRSGHTDRGTFGDFTCGGNVGPAGHVWLTAEVRIFATAGAAAVSYANDDKAGARRVAGVGTSAAGSLLPGAGYVLLVTDGNLELRLQVGAVGPTPSPAELQQPAIDTAARTLARLRT